ncbi:MAG: NAD-dependent epimerase/dehydratase family protein [Candidatus Didemnitutus sp.]|nr:NAD-dependent epimerase/dehydratase family protein [Candidatus Didemnitutus sp.]
MSEPVFITGASGFIGGKLAERLLADGRSVRVLARRPLPELARRGAEVVPGDLHDRAALDRGCAGAATVFHVAGRVGVWGPAADFFRVNVEGTRCVVAACQRAAVPRLVHTSSPSVVFNGGDLAGVDESAPLCTEAPCAYPTSKAAAERLLRAANSPTLATVSLRPHLVWGPGDQNVVPRVLALARRGRLRIVGAGRNLVDCTHITNVVDAHVLAEQALARCHLLGDKSTARDPRGRAYFITNGEPVVLWEWINELLRGLDLPPVTRHVSLRRAYAAGAVLEAVWRVLPLTGEPPMTRFVAKELATDHWFNLGAARRDLGYAPQVTMAAGTADLLAHYRATGRF